MNLPKIVGIDYSMSNPSMCVHVGNKWSFNNCKFYFLTGKKKHTGSTSPFIEGYLHNEKYSSQEERFDAISGFFLTMLPSPFDSEVFIEGYAFGAKGQVFNIGENTGLLKYKLFKQKFKYSVFAPSAVKKFATEKGNADKVKMHDAFVKETGVYLDRHFSVVAGASPAADLVDSYFIAKLGYKTILDRDYPNNP